MTPEQIKSISSTVASTKKSIAVLNDGSMLYAPATTLGTMHRINSLLADVKMEVTDEKLNIHNLLTNNIEVTARVVAELVHNAPDCPDSLPQELMEKLTIDQLESTVLAVVEALDVKRFFLITTYLNQVRIKIENIQDQKAHGLSLETSANTSDGHLST